jgi:hypothetical protein
MTGLLRKVNAEGQRKKGAREVMKARSDRRAGSIPQVSRKETESGCVAQTGEAESHLYFSHHGKFPTS